MNASTMPAPVSALSASPIPIPIDAFLPHMRDVTHCEQSLNELNLMWRMIESSARMNCPVESAPILPTMAAMRAGFKQLEHELVDSLVREKVMTAHAEIATKAAYVIDIVVRNLYERTADVGFLAIDDTLCRFVAGHADADPAAAIRARLLAYRSKYTVYDEIILLDTQGRVLMQTDPDAPLQASRDALLATTLASDSYVETFRASDLRPGKRQALIYSRRMLDPVSGNVAGVLCLCFNFEDEMAGIFSTHSDPTARSSMLLVDGAGVVLASGDESWIAPGTRVPRNHADEMRLMMHGGRQYLVHTCGAAGYQGYPGPAGWQGQVMIPLDVAFSVAGGRALKTLAPEMSGGLLSHADSFCPPLHDIVSAAETIRRVVWNGQVMTAGQSGDLAKLKVILDQISETGKRSDDLFAQSISNLYDTALVARMRKARHLASLLVDLLDRNLYERANDCRWWAMAPELRRMLASGQRDADTTVRTAAMLDFINSLYTVYTRIFVYDRDGRILASSRDTDRANPVAGRDIAPDVLAQVHGLVDEQRYLVTPFEASDLYDGRPTYVYHAALRAPDDERDVVGGIGIVFDSAPELAAMLEGGIGDRPGTTALLIERSGAIVASTDPARPVGSMLTLDPELLALPAGGSHASMVMHDGNYAIRALKVGAGYREFKQSDGYQADVISVVFDVFGEQRLPASGSSGDSADLLGALAVEDAGASEFATFFVGGTLFAVAAENVRQALPASRLASLSMGAGAERIGLVALEDADDGQFVWVFDLRYILTGRAGEMGRSSQIIVIEQGGRKVGLLVDALHKVPRFDQSQIVPTPFGGGVLVPRVIKANQGALLIQVLDAVYLLDTLFTVQV